MLWECPRNCRCTGKLTPEGPDNRCIAATKVAATNGLALRGGPAGSISRGAVSSALTLTWPLTCGNARARAREAGSADAARVAGILACVPGGWRLFARHQL